MPKQVYKAHKKYKFKRLHLPLEKYIILKKCDMHSMLLASSTRKSNDTLRNDGRINLSQNSFALSTDIAPILNDGKLCQKLAESFDSKENSFERPEFSSFENSFDTKALVSYLQSLNNHKIIENEIRFDKQIVNGQACIIMSDSLNKVDSLFYLKLIRFQETSRFEFNMTQECLQNLQVSSFCNENLAISLEKLVKINILKAYNCVNDISIQSAIKGIKVFYSSYLSENGLAVRNKKQDLHRSCNCSVMAEKSGILKVKTESKRNYKEYKLISNINEMCQIFHIVFEMQSMQQKILIMMYSYKSFTLCTMPFSSLTYSHPISQNIFYIFDEFRSKMSIEISKLWEDMKELESKITRNIERHFHAVHMLHLFLARSNLHVSEFRLLDLEEKLLHIFPNIVNAPNCKWFNNEQHCCLGKRKLDEYEMNNQFEEFSSVKRCKMIKRECNTRQQITFCQDNNNNQLQMILDGARLRAFETEGKEKLNTYKVVSIVKCIEFDDGKKCNKETKIVNGYALNNIMLHDQEKNICIDKVKSKATLFRSNPILASHQENILIILENTANNKYDKIHHFIYATNLETIYLNRFFSVYFEKFHFAPTISKFSVKRRFDDGNDYNHPDDAIYERNATPNIAFKKFKMKLHQLSNVQENPVICTKKDDQRKRDSAYNSSQTASENNADYYKEAIKSIIIDSKDKVGGKAEFRKRKYDTEDNQEGLKGDIEIDSKCDTEDNIGNIKKSKNEYNLMKLNESIFDTFFSKSLNCDSLWKGKCIVEPLAISVQSIKAASSSNGKETVRKISVLKIQDSETECGSINLAPITVLDQDENQKIDLEKEENFEEILIKNIDKSEHNILNGKNKHFMNNNELGITNAEESKIFDNAEKRDASCQTDVHACSLQITPVLTDLQVKSAVSNYMQNYFSQTVCLRKSLFTNNAAVNHKKITKKSSDINSYYGSAYDDEARSDEEATGKFADDIDSLEENEHIVPSNGSEKKRKTSKVRMGLSRLQKIKPLHPYLRYEKDFLY